MITRKQFTETENPHEFGSLAHRKFSKNMHEKYYGQFLKEDASCYVKFLVKILVSFNKIESNLSMPGTELAKWDCLKNRAQNIFNTRLFTDCEYPGKFTCREVCYSLSDVVCFAKLAAKNTLLEIGYVEKWEQTKFGWECFLVKVGKEQNHSNAER